MTTTTAPRTTKAIDAEIAQARAGITALEARRPEIVRLRALTQDEAEDRALRMESVGIPDDIRVLEQRIVNLQAERPLADSRKALIEYEQVSIERRDLLLKVKELDERRAERQRLDEQDTAQREVLREKLDLLAGESRWAKQRLSGRDAHQKANAIDAKYKVEGDS